MKRRVGLPFFVPSFLLCEVSLVFWNSFVSLVEVLFYLSNVVGTCLVVLNIVLAACMHYESIIIIVFFAKSGYGNQQRIHLRCRQFADVRTFNPDDKFSEMIRLGPQSVICKINLLSRQIDALKCLFRCMSLRSHLLFVARSI